MRQLAVSQNRPENVIEVVGDAAGQRADRLHFLRLSQLRFQLFLVGLCLLLPADVHGGAHESIRLACRIAQATPTREHPAPLSVTLADAVFAFIARRAPLEVIRQCAVHARHVAGMNDRQFPPLGARCYHAVVAATLQHLHLRRQEQSIRRYVPVPVTLVRSFHSKRITLLAFTQRALTCLDALQLTQQSSNGQDAERRNDERSQAEPDRFVAPRLQRDRLFASDRELQRRIRDVRNGDESSLSIDGAHESCCGRKRGVRELRELLPDLVRDWWITDEQRSIFAQEVSCAATAKVDRLIEAFEVLEIHDSGDDACEVAFLVFEASCKHDTRAVFRTGDDRLTDV